MISNTADMAADNSSFPPCNLFGSPVEVIIIIDAMIIIMSAIPPIIPTPQRMTNEARAPLSFMGIQPMAVGIPLASEAPRGTQTGKSIGLGLPVSSIHVPPVAGLLHFRFGPLHIHPPIPAQHGLPSAVQSTGGGFGF